MNLSHTRTLVRAVLLASALVIPGAGAYAPPAGEPPFAWFELRGVPITAYTSRPEETDDTPFTTASGVRVKDGIIACNFLPFGARVAIPKRFGAQVFTVEDRMHPRNARAVDVWMRYLCAAREFGRDTVDIVVVWPRAESPPVDTTEEQ